MMIKNTGLQAAQAVWHNRDDTPLLFFVGCGLIIFAAKVLIK